MQTQWLLHTGKDKLLLFASGWGMDAAPFQPLASESLDVFMLYDYRDLEVPVDLPALCRPYREVHLLAWSLGVWVCRRLRALLPERMVSSLAVNGTLQPIHARHGIAPLIFEATLENLSTHTLKDFYQNMFLEDEHARLFFQRPPVRPVAEVIQELQQLKTFILADPEPGEISDFGAAMIGKHDIIIPARHQLQFWKNHSACQMVTAGHFPFYLWQRWEDMLAYATYE